MPAHGKMPASRAKTTRAGVVGVRGRAVFARLPALGLLLLIIGLSAFLVDLLRRRAQASEMFRVDPSLVELGEPPAFLPERVGEEIRALACVEPRSIFDDGLVGEMRASLCRHAWVRSVTATRRLLPNRVAVEVELRVPIAVVDVGAWRLTVDREGYVLEDHASLAPEGLVRIRGDKRSVPRIPRVGGRFHSDAVLDGIAVALDLRRNSAHAFFRHADATVAVIDVTNVGKASGSEIVLELGCGTLVEWGSASSAALGPLELGASHKLDNLLIVQDRHPGMQGVARVHAAARDPFVTLAQ